MGVSRYNSEGYPDPTTYGALSNIENEMKAASLRSNIRKSDYRKC